MTKYKYCSLDLSKEDFGIKHEYNEFVLVPRFAFSNEAQAKQGIKEILHGLRLLKAVSVQVSILSDDDTTESIKKRAFNKMLEETTG